MTWSELSKMVGWNPRLVNYPKLEDVGAAIKSGEWARILEWYRFLPSPCNEKEKYVLDNIVQAFMLGREVCNG